MNTVLLLILVYTDKSCGCASWETQMSFKTPMCLAKCQEFYCQGRKFWRQRNSGIIRLHLSFLEVFSRKGPPFPLAHFYDLCLIFTVINHILCSLDLESPKGQCVKVWVLSLGLLKCNRNRRGNIQCRKSSGCYWTWKIEDIMGYPSWFASLSPSSPHHNRSGFALSHILGMTCNHRSMTG